MRTEIAFLIFAFMVEAAQAKDHGFRVGETTILMRGGSLAIDVNPNAWFSSDRGGLNPEGGIVHKVVMVPANGGSKCVLSKTGDAGLVFTTRHCAKVKAVSPDNFMIELSYTTNRDEEMKAAERMYGPVVSATEMHFSLSTAGNSCKSNTTVNFSRSTDGKITNGPLGVTTCEAIGAR